MRSGLWAVGLIAVVGTSGCRQVAGIEDTPPTDLATSLCGLPYGTTACASCASASCCAESNACAGDATCAAYEGCLGGCKGDPACRQRCAIAHPAGTGSQVSALSACLASKCETACDLTCGALVDYLVEPGSAAACQSCMATTTGACAATRACASSVDCQAIVRCGNACEPASAATCFQGCVFGDAGVNPAWGIVPDAGYGSGPGAEPWAQFTNAHNGVCASACVGNYWECVGHTSWPTPRTPNATLVAYVKDFDGPFVPEADIDLCRQDDVDCGSWVAHTMTDPTGLASIPFANQGNAGVMNLGLTGFVRTTKPGYVTNYYYWGSPVSEPEIVVEPVVSTVTRYQQILANLSVVADTNRGAVTVVVRDCTNNGAGGVRIALSGADSMTQAFTTLGAEVPSMVTDSTGILIFTNVRAGALTLTATPTALKTPSSTVAAYVHAGLGVATTVLMLPTPTSQ